MEYEYPLFEDWSTQEKIDAVSFYALIEDANESSVDSQTLLNAYRIFKQIVPTKDDEKKIDQAFFELSGYSIYKTIKEAKTNAIVRMKK